MALFLAACADTDMAVPADVPDAAPVSAQDRFVAAVTADGCDLTAQNTAMIMDQATLSRADLARIMTDLRAAGQGEIAGDSFRLTDGACAA